MSVRLFAWFASICAALLSSALVPATAQTQPMKFIVGLAPGGAVDPYARIISERMAKALNRTIIVENRPGATGNISAQFIIDQPADGQLIWVGTQALTEINPSVFDNLKWKIDDFEPLIKGVQAPLVFVAHPSVPANNFAEFVTWAKANRGKQSYSSYTAGTPSHFLGFQLNEKFDLDLTHVPYRGSGLQTNGLIAGHSLFGFAQVNTSAPQVAAGKLKALGITSAERWPQMKDVPTFAELGQPEFTTRVWFGLLVKKDPTSWRVSPRRRRRRTRTPKCGASWKRRATKSPAKPGRNCCRTSRRSSRAGPGS